MLKEVDICRYQPDTVRDYSQFQALASTENPELTALWAAADSVFQDQFIETLTENGCARWETILEISPKGTDTLAERRFRIKARVNEDIPYTWRMLVGVLDTLCGVGGYKMTLYHDTYRLKILLELTVKKMYDEVESTVKRVIPANLILEVSLRYNQHGTVGQYTHRQLSKWTHEKIREEVLTE